MKKIIEEIRGSASSYGSLPFWSWNDRLEEEELRKQIRDMKKLGMSGFFMHARGGLETEYLSDEWFDCINACIDEAEKQGMEAWCYDENGWPSGFAGGALLKDKANFTVAISEKSDPFPSLPDEDIIAVYQKNADGTFTRVTEDCGNEEYLILFTEYDESYVDTLDGSITEKYIELTHEEYKRRIDPKLFGNGRPMPGFFTDEPQYYREKNPYSNILPKEFEKAYGYSIYDALPAIFFDFDGADKFRYDYYYLVHKLFINNFIKKVYAWCEANGVALTGHAVEESSLGGQMMCIGGVMPFYQYETIPGIDYLARNIASDLAHKQLGSACAQLGKKKALSEMFGCCGWDVSPTELKRIAEVQYVGGVNLMCQHLYPYSERGQRKRDYPLHYSYHNPWHDALAEFDFYFNNLGATLSRGEEYAPILVIHPIHGAYCKYKKHQPLGEIEDKSFALCHFLGQNQIPYHYGDEWMMADMAKVNGKTISVGQCTYEAVIVPFTYSLDSTTVALLKEFSDNGGKIYLYDGVPPYIDGAPAEGRLDWLTSTMTKEELFAMREAVITLNGANVPGLRKMTRVTEEGRLVYITNIDSTPLTPVKVSLPAGTWSALDMHTLETFPVVQKTEGDRTIVTLSFTDGRSYVLVENVTAEGEASYALPTEFIPVPDTAVLAEKPVNVLTLDTAELSKDGVHYDAPLALMGIKDNLLKEKYNGTVWLRFPFETETIPTSLRLAVEPMYQSITVNGTPVTPDPEAWWFDKSFATADLVPTLRMGKNEIVIEVNHYQRDYVYYVLYGGVSESLRNCLAFDTEIECIYLIGDFALRCDGTFTESVRNSVVYDGGFVLTQQPDTVSARNTVLSGYPFFSGAMTLAFPYEYHAGNPTWLRLDGRFATAEIQVNGTPAGTMFFDRMLDLAEFLKEGENTITVTICNSMRNTMGPHHAGDPEPYGVGPWVFSFEKEWNGRECRAHRDTYAFVKFGLVK